MNTMSRTLPRTTLVLQMHWILARSTDLFIANSPLSFQNTIADSNGLFNFHEMVIQLFKKHSPIERHNREYKYFDQTKFKNNLNEKLNKDIFNYESFETDFIEVLNKYASLRKKFLRANHAPYITKTLRKAVMDRSQLETKYRKTKTQTKLKLYKTFVVSYIWGKEENAMNH